MRFAGRIAAALLAIVAGGSLAAAKEWTTIRIGTDATYPPFESIDSGGKFVGFDIEILNAICDELKVKCEFINQDFDGIIPALVAGKFDVIDSDLDHRGAQEDHRFHRQVLQHAAAIVARKDAGIRASVDDLPARRSA
jgi:polar amino acid transport system substrate-binding protein